MSDNIDFKKLFYYRTMERIHGEPTYNLLKNLKDRIKANAASITSRLGGGAHGHLGLVLDPPIYANVSAVPYVRPLHPGDLNIPVAATARHENGLREDHKRDLKLFHDTVDIEKDLKSQIVEAIDPIYLEDLIDPTTKTITQSIPDNFTYLFDTYCDVLQKRLQKRKNKLNQ